eukprot:6475178-Amphidinium_carterae.1
MSGNASQACCVRAILSGFPLLLERPLESASCMRQHAFHAKTLLSHRDKTGNNCKNNGQLAFSRREESKAAAQVKTWQLNAQPAA